MITSKEWLPRIAKARSEEELVRTVREYLDAWEPSEIEKLPPHCRVALVSAGHDISWGAVTLVQCELKGGMDEETAETVRNMADVFVAAQQRLREILGQRYDPAPA